MNKHSISEFPTHPEESPFGYTPGQLLQLLIMRPQVVVEAVHQEVFSPGFIARYALITSILTSVFFAWGSVIQFPSEWQLTSQQLVLRFGFSFLLTFFAVWGLTALWIVAQKFSGWFWNFPLSLKTTITLACLGITYYLLIFALSIPVFLVAGFSPLIAEIVLFILNIVSLILSFRLFVTAYQIIPQAPRKKSLLIATFPAVLALVTYIATITLVYFAELPHLQAH